MDGRRTRVDRVSTWWGSLRERDASTLRASRWLPATLMLATAAAAASLPPAWHHLLVPANGSFGPLITEVINGLDTSNWLIAAAAVELALAIRTYAAASSPGVKWVVTVVAFAVVTGMVVDYFDWSLRGVSLTVQPYYGPGFFLALGSAVLMVVAAVLAWRVPD
jgi:hypothetical protein